MQSNSLKSLWIFLIVLPGLGLAQSTSVKIANKVKPHYPQIAIRAGIEGRVVLLVPIDTQGIPGDPRVIESPNPVLTKAASWAALHSQYTPARDSIGPIASTIEFQFRFVCPRDSVGQPMLPAVFVEPPKKQKFTIPCYRICLFGHWLSGEIEVVQIENRVYVGGIRVYIPHYTNEIRRGFTDSQMLEELLWEANCLLRDNLILGNGWEWANEEVRRLFTEYPAQVECREIGTGKYCVAIGQATSEMEIPKECPPFDYSNQQERAYLRKAGQTYYYWVSTLKAKVESGGFYFLSHFYSGGIGKNTEGGQYLATKLSEGKVNGRGPLFRLGEMQGVGISPTVCDMLIAPDWIFLR